MRQAEVEEVAGIVRDSVACGEDDLPLAIEIAERLLGAGAVVYGAPSLPARLVGNTIVVPEGHPDLNFAVAHECAEWALRELVLWRGEHAQRERAANAIAAAILAPPVAVSRAYEHYGERFESLASVFGMSQTAIVLRLAEVKPQSRAIVTRSGHVLTRIFADETRELFARSSKVRGIARAFAAAAQGKREIAGVVRATLRGGIDEGRIALRAG
jgi:hypothetical protein